MVQKDLVPFLTALNLPSSTFLLCLIVTVVLTFSFLLTMDKLLFGLFIMNNKNVVLLHAWNKQILFVVLMTINDDARCSYLILFRKMMVCLHWMLIKFFLLQSYYRQISYVLLKRCPVFLLLNKWLVFLLLCFK